jgi:hypothetical protein
MYRSHIGKWLLSVVLMAFLVLPCAFAQETTAGFQGIVKDPSGAAVAKATVQVSVPLIGTRRVQTDDTGELPVCARTQEYT